MRGKLRSSFIMFEHSSTALFFTLFYGLFSFCFVVGPSDFRSVGLTVDALLSRWLGSEEIDFINYHIKRTSATVVIHSFIPLGYILGLSVTPDSIFQFSDLVALKIPIGWKIYFIASILIFIAGISLAYFWSINDWSYHPIATNLSLYVDQSSGETRPTSAWRVKASEINNEYRRIDKYATSFTGWSRAIVTSSWIIVSTLYNVQCTPQDKATVSVFGSEEHDLSPDSNFMVQYINIRIKPTLKRELKPYFVRMQSVEFSDFKDHIFSRVYVLPTVKILQSTDEIFLKEFREVIKKNSSYAYAEEIEQCIGCLQKDAEVKLVKNCIDQPRDNCVQCNCKPLWCADCMGKWFASRQDQNNTSTWLGGTATCPMCRNKFCLLDVCPLSQ